MDQVTVNTFIILQNIFIYKKSYFKLKFIKVFCFYSENRKERKRQKEMYTDRSGWWRNTIKVGEISRNIQQIIKKITRTLVSETFMSIFSVQVASV